MRRAGLIALGGAAGATLRYAATWSANPWLVTLAVNAAGAFALGVLLARLAARPEREAVLRPLVAVGFLGAFTTFSAFAVLMVMLSPFPLATLGYGAAMLLVGLGAARAGLAVGAPR